MTNGFYILWVCVWKLFFTFSIKRLILNQLIMAMIDKYLSALMQILLFNHLSGQMKQLINQQLEARILAGISKDSPSNMRQQAPAAGRRRSLRVQAQAACISSDAHAISNMHACLYQHNCYICNVTVLIKSSSATHTHTSIVQYSQCTCRHVRTRLTYYSLYILIDDVSDQTIALK